MQSFGILVELHYAELLEHVRRRWGAKLAARCEPADVLQDALLTAAGSFRTFEPERGHSFAGWVLGIASNLVKARQDREQPKRRRYDRSLPLDAVTSLAQDQLESLGFSEDAPPEVLLERREQLERLVKALDRLGPLHREVLLWRDFVRLPWDTIAFLLAGRSVGATRQLHARATKALRRELERP